MREIEDHCQKHGDYPANLEEVKCQECRLSEGKLLPHDPTYRKLSSGFDLFLVGLDGFRIANDVAFPWMMWGTCSYSWLGGEWRDDNTMNPMDPSDVAGKALEKVVYDLRIFLAGLGECPELLDDSFWTSVQNPAKCIGGRYSRKDPWGERYVIRKVPSGYHVFSKGPDRKPDTDDDIYAGDKSERCQEPISQRKATLLARGTIVCFEQDSVMARKAMEIRRASGSCGCSFIGLSQ